MTKRNLYNAILDIPLFAKQLMTEAEKAGCWETGIVSDRKNRGTAINADLYGYNESLHLAVVQVRQTEFHPRRYNKTRKNYFLVGRLESGAIFTHSIESPCRSKLAMSDAAFCVDYVLAKIWGVKINELNDVVRQGDVAFIPVAAIPADAELVEGAIIRESHKVTGPVYKHQGGYYVKRGAKMEHLKKEHKTIKATEGHYRVVPGFRAESYSFSLETAD